MTEDRRDNGAAGASRDAVDHLIDEALQSISTPRSVDLRAQVIGRLDEPTAEPRAWFDLALRPATLAAAGALAVVIGVAATWWHVDQELANLPAARARATAMRGPGKTSMPGPAEPAVSGAGPATELARVDAGGGPGAGPAGGGIRAPWLRRVGPDAGGASVGDDIGVSEPAEAHLPGAPAGDLGDPIAPMPPPRPIVIRAIVPAPIVLAPPVSELAVPVGTTPIEDPTRGGSGPGKTGGIRP